MSRRFSQAVVSLALLASLTACGFTPLYATGSVTGGLSQITIEAPDGRTAYLLRERLDDALALGRDATPLYKLDYTLTERRDPRGLGPDNAASRYELTVQCDYRLTNIATGAVLTSGAETVLITYDAVDAPYAGVAAQQDSQERAAAELARRLRINLARYFAGLRP